MTLRKGDKGEPVATLQRALNAAGASPVLATDGAFGPMTFVALVSYQGKHGLVADGIAGSKTLAALGLAAPVLAPPSTPPPPSAPASLEVPRVRTPVALTLLRQTLALSWRVRFGTDATAIELRMALAHLRHEHGVEVGPGGSLQFRASFCNNLGNLMTGGKWTGHWFRMTAIEREGGVEVPRKSTWRAFPDLTAGVNGYLSSMSNTFPKMFAAFSTGDPVKVAKAGKLEGYFTDDATYAETMIDFRDRLRDADAAEIARLRHLAEERVDSIPDSEPAASKRKKARA
jgi:peptidoglycan hydrolase-like protein with peptidoglycan-binding domain